MVNRHKQKSKAHPYTLGAAQAQYQVFRKQPITLPSLESKRRFDVEAFKYECPRCQKQNKDCDLCGGAVWFRVEEFLEM